MEYLVMVLEMPGYRVRDAFYTPIGGIPYCYGRHWNESWKASERPLSIYTYQRTRGFAMQGLQNQNVIQAVCDSCDSCDN